MKSLAIVCLSVIGHATVVTRVHASLRNHLSLTQITEEDEKSFCKTVDDAVTRYGTCATIPTALPSCDGFTSCAACQGNEGCMWEAGREPHTGQCGIEKFTWRGLGRIWGSTLKTVCNNAINYRSVQATLAKSYFLAEIIFARTVLEFGSQQEKEAEVEASDASTQIKNIIDESPNDFDAIQNVKTEDDLTTAATNLKAKQATAVDAVVSAKQKQFAAAKKLASWEATTRDGVSVPAEADMLLTRCPNTEKDVAQEGQNIVWHLQALHERVAGLKAKHPPTSEKLNSLYAEFDKMFQRTEAKFAQINTEYTKLAVVPTENTENQGEEILPKLRTIAGCANPATKV